MRVPALPLVLLSLLAVLLAPVAAADHAYSHRYLVLGQVVDGNGHPVENVTVSLALSGVSAEGPCANQPGTETEAFGPMRTRPTTNARGEFMFCSHLHTLARGVPAKATLRASAFGENVTAEADLDPFFRSSFVVLRLNHTPSADADVPAVGIRQVVAARLWSAAPAGVTVEGVRVYGTTLNGVPVNVTVEHANGTVTESGVTNNFGDVALPLDLLVGEARGARVVVEALGRAYETTLAQEGITYLKVNATGAGPAPGTPAPASPGPVGGTAATPPPTAGAPDTAVTPTPGGPESEMPLPAALVLVAAALGALALARRRR